MSQERFYKIKFFVENILQSCSNLYFPDQNLFLQEVLLNYEGIVKNLSSTKPRQRGRTEITLITLKEAKSGYDWNALLADGCKTFERKEIMSIFQGLEFKGYKIFMDNTFTTNFILNVLKTKKIFASGIISEKKMTISEDLKRKIAEINKPDETAFFKNKDLFLTIWNQYSKKIVSLANFEDFTIDKIKKARKIGYFSKIEYKLYEYEAPRIINDTIENTKGNDYLNRGMDYFSLDYQRKKSLLCQIWNREWKLLKFYENGMKKIKIMKMNRDRKK